MANFSQAWLSLAGVIGAFAFNVAWQLVHCRLVRGRNLVGTVATGFVAGFVLLVVCELCQWRRENGASSIWLDFFLANIPLYVCLSYGYANLVQLSQCSVRIRIYEEICRHADGLELPRLREMYNEQDMIRTRVRRLMDSGDLYQQDGMYRVGRRRLVWVATVVFALKRFVLGKESEFQGGGEEVESPERVRSN